MTDDSPIYHIGKLRPHRARIALGSSLLEAIIMLLLVLVTLSVVTAILTGSLRQARTADQLDRATLAATNVAENFSADPTSVPQSQAEGDLTTTCDVTPEARADGTLYRAHITVLHEGEQVYALDTARYVDGQGGGR